MKHYCDECGGSLVLLSSQNCKLCPTCGVEIVWELDEDQPSIYGDRVPEGFDPYSSK